MKNHTLRHRQYGISWGICITIACEVSKKSAYQGEIAYSSNCLFLDIGVAWIKNNSENESMMTSFKQGLKLIAPSFCTQVNEPRVINIVNIDYNPADFMVEGLGYALANWMDKEYKLGIKLPPIEYNQETNKYIFPYSL